MKQFIKRNIGGWLIMLPSIALFLFFVWVPLASNVSLSFFETQGYTKVKFVGFDNYLAVIKEPVFIKAFINTFKYTFWSLIIGFFIPIILALLLSEIIHFKSFFRTFIYFPNIIPGLAVVIMWKFLYDPDPNGALNAILAIFNLPALSWLNNRFFVIPLIVLTMTWKGAGATTLIYLAVLQGIDNTYYEAARIEGANLWQRFRYITIPHLLPTIRMLFILQIISVFQVFYEPYVMTSGGPDNASISLLQLVYRYAFTIGETDKAAALGVIVALMLITLTVIYLRFTKEKE